MELSKVLEKELLEGRFWTHSKMLVEGCTKVSPGCQNCWSEAMAKRFGGMVDESGEFDGTIKEHPERCLEILPKSRNRSPRVWTYWNDIFHEKVTEALHCRLFNLIDCSTDFHIVCTKRPERAVEFFRMYPGQTQAANLIIMVTMEDQIRVNERSHAAFKLTQQGLKVGMLVEPMLSLIDISLIGWKPEWIICGPENGKGKREWNPDRAIYLQKDAQKRGIPFYYKAGLLNGKRYIETP